jgi:hypothetical protein
LQFNFKLLLDLLDGRVVWVFPKLTGSARPEDVLLVKLGLVELLGVVVVSVLLFGE